VGDRTTLNELFFLLRDSLKTHGVSETAKPVYREFRAGDVRHSQADISKAHAQLGYEPQYNINSGILVVTSWHAAFTA
jgi:UDP-N-acetylglucosamine 4-epimerase